MNAIKGEDGTPIAYSRGGWHTRATPSQVVAGDWAAAELLRGKSGLPATDATGPACCQIAILIGGGVPGMHSGEGLTPDKTFTGQGLTGADRARPGLREALGACRAGDTLVVTKLDRLACSLRCEGHRRRAHPRRSQAQHRRLRPRPRNRVLRYSAWELMESSLASCGCRPIGLWMG